MLNKHHINSGLGLSPKCDTMHKLMQILDENAELPFQITKLTTSTWKGEWTLYHRDVLEVIRFYFGMQDFAGHILDTYMSAPCIR